METKIANLLWQTYKYNITTKSVFLYKQNQNLIQKNYFNYSKMKFQYKNYLFNECRIANKTSNYF